MSHADVGGNDNKHFSPRHTFTINPSDSAFKIFAEPAPRILEGELDRIILEGIKAYQNNGLPFPVIAFFMLHSANAFAIALANVSPAKCIVSAGPLKFIGNVKVPFVTSNLITNQVSLKPPEHLLFEMDDNYNKILHPGSAHILDFR